MTNVFRIGMSAMPRVAVVVLLIGFLTGCQDQTAPIASPPPGGHDLLSKPPASLLRS
jgi:hypothetical protein